MTLLIARPDIYLRKLMFAAWKTSSQKILIKNCMHVQHALFSSFVTVNPTAFRKLLVSVNKLVRQANNITINL